MLGRLKKTLGPGILFASTAIGVSHLVQSTRAGADYGFTLIWVLVVANLFKYPFFEFASRYANVKGESILVGYQRKGRWPLILYVILSFISMFIVAAAVSFVCAGLLSYILRVNISMEWVILLLFLFTAFVLLRGGFGFLDKFIKVIGAILLISTLLAFVMSLSSGPVIEFERWDTPTIWTDEGWIFLIALMGWMPTAVDLSAWNSIWTVERIRETGYHPSLKETLFEFRLGYLLSAVLSLIFLILGAYSMHSSGEQFSSSASVFASQLIDMFSGNLGDWSIWVISLAAFSVMLSTTLTVFDGYARAIRESFSLLNADQSWNSYQNWLIVILVGAMSISFFFVGQLKNLVDLATILSFIIAPIIGVLNYKLVFSSEFPLDSKPNLFLKTLSWLGIIYLTAFSLLFLWRMILN